MSYETKIDRTGGPDACHVWTAGKDRAGYGHIRVDKRQWQAHRYVWTQEVGRIPDHLVVCHICDNPSCVNVRHLWLGTIRHNALDMKYKGRASGGKRGRQPLPPDKQAQIRMMRFAGSTIEETSRVVGCSVSAVYTYCRRVK